MKFLPTKKIIYAFFALVLILVSLPLLIAYKYYQVSTLKPSITLSAVKIIPDSNIKLGQIVDLGIEMECPWNIRPVSVETKPGKGTQNAGKPSIQVSKTDWGTRKWIIKSSIRSFNIGDTEKGMISIETNIALNDGKNFVELEIPSFNVEPLDVGNSDQLSVAGKINIAQKRNLMFIYLGLIILTLLIIASAFFLIKHKRNEKKIVFLPWQIALIEICELRRGFAQKKLSPEVCFSRLTDVIMAYIEKRFRLRAMEQTTYEFLHSLKYGKNPLEEKHKEFLGNFLQSADLVKFAKMPAESDVLNNAIQKAEDLVNSTIPSKEPPPSNQNGAKEAFKNV